MPIMIRCNCGQQLQVQDGTSGQRVRCPTCGNVMQVPSSPFSSTPQVSAKPPVANPFASSQPGFAAGAPGWSEPPAKQGMSVVAIILMVLGGLGLMVVLACAGSTWIMARQFQQTINDFNLDTAWQEEELEERSDDYAVARQSFRTKPLRSGPSPQQHDPTYRTDLTPITYRSGDLLLSAYVDPAPADGTPRPAVVFLHSGFAFGPGDYEMAQPYRDAGFIVMQPLLRGENGQPGYFTMLYDEIDDVLAATDTLAALPYVDRNRIFIAGHMEGGTLALLSAMAANKYRGAVAFSSAMNLTGVPNHTFNRYDAPFDTDDPEEYEMRSPIAFARSFKCPARLYIGSADYLLNSSTFQTADRARTHGIDVQAEVIPGDQMTHVPASIQKSIDFFMQLGSVNNAQPDAAVPPTAEAPAGDPPPAAEKPVAENPTAESPP